MNIYSAIKERIQRRRDEKYFLKSIEIYSAAANELLWGDRNEARRLLHKLGVAL